MTLPPGVPFAPGNHEVMTHTLDRTDNEPKTSVEDALVWAPQVGATHIGVSVNDSSVHSGSERHEEARVAWSAPGVSSVDNLIQVAV